jgi:hypothetical protein
MLAALLLLANESIGGNAPALQRRSTFRRSVYMFYQIQQRDETNQRLCCALVKQPKINKIEPRKGSKLWPTTKTWPSIEIPLQTRRRQNTHTLKCTSTYKLGFTPSFCDDTQHLVLQ